MNLENKFIPITEEQQNKIYEIANLIQENPKDESLYQDYKEYHNYLTIQGYDYRQLRTYNKIVKEARELWKK